jgi:hypothetical protein
MAGDPNENVQAILQRDTTARLDAIVRRHGGQPHSVEHSDGPRFPPTGRFKIEQDGLFDDTPPTEDSK